jgi:hypothetical protein
VEIGQRIAIVSLCLAFYDYNNQKGTLIALMIIVYMVEVKKNVTQLKN